jgi:hypothetical protein
MVLMALRRFILVKHSKVKKKKVSKQQRIYEICVLQDLSNSAWLKRKFSEVRILVRIEAMTDFVFLELYVVIEGRASTRWHQWMSFIIQESNQTIINEKIVLFDFTKFKTAKVPAGKYKFKFAFKVPPFVPASFQSYYIDEIDYSVRAVLDIPWGLKKRDCVAFKIDRRDDYNCACFRTLCIKEITRTMRFLDFASGHFTMTVSIPYSVYTPGSDIRVTIHIDNKTSKTIGPISIKLVQNVVKKK